MARSLLIPLFIPVAMAASGITTALAQDAMRSQAHAPAQRSMQVISDDLDYPWSIAQAGDQLLLTEKAGNVVVVENGQQRRYPLQTSESIADEGGAGLLGMVLAKDFAQTGIGYFYHAYRTDAGLANKVIQAQFDGNAWQETQVLLTGIPGHRLYNGGALSIGPDGLLYVATGWAASREWPQSRTSLAGKVLRMTLDGQVPADNPFPDSLVYSYGHRNPQGMAWSPAGELFVVEHGESGHDEINRIRPGANYGWPLAQGSERRGGMQPAWIESGRSTWAPAGAAFVGEELLVAALGSRELLVVDEEAAMLRRVFSSGDRIRGVLPLGQDLVMITSNRSPRGEGPSNDRLLRLSPGR